MSTLQESLFLVLCNDAELAAHEARAKQAGVQLVTAPMFEGIHQVLVAEHAESLVWIERAMLEQAGITADDARALAMTNLRKRTPTPLGSVKMHPDHMVFAVGVDDGLGSGRFLLHDLFAPLRAALPPDAELLVRVITRGLVVCCMNVAADMQWVDEMCAKGKNVPAFIGGPWLAWTPESWALVAVGGE